MSTPCADVRAKVIASTGVKSLGAVRGTRLAPMLGKRFLLRRSRSASPGVLVGGCGVGVCWGVGCGW